MDANQAPTMLTSEQKQLLSETREAAKTLGDARTRFTRAMASVGAALGISDLSESQLGILQSIVLISESPVVDVALPDFVNTRDKTPAANVNRTGAERKEPSLKFRIARVLQEAKRTMSGSEIHDALEKHGWLPQGAANTRTYVSHYLSTYKDVFLRDSDAGRGHYKLAPDFAVRVQTPKVQAKPKTVKVKAKAKAAKSTGKPEKKMNKSEFIRAHSDMKPADVVEKAKKAGMTFSVEYVYTIRQNAKKLTKTAAPVAETQENVTPQIMKVLQNTSEPFTIPQITKAAKLGDRYRSVTAVLMVLKKRDVADTTGEKSESGHALWKVDPKALSSYLSN